MLVADVVSRVRRIFGDEASVQIADTDIYNWINDAQLEIVAANGLLMTKASQNVVAAQANYTLPTDCLALASVWFDGAKLEGMSWQDAEERIIQMQSAPSGNVTLPTARVPDFFYVFNNNSTTPPLVTTLALYPVPNAAISNGLTIFYSRKPATVTVAVEMEIDSIYHKAIVDACLAQAYELDENFQAASLKTKQVKDSTDQLSEDETWTRRDVYPSITVRNEDAW